MAHRRPGGRAGRRGGHAPVATVPGWPVPRRSGRPGRRGERDPAVGGRCRDRPRSRSPAGSPGTRRSSGGPTAGRSTTCAGTATAGGAGSTCTGWAPIRRPTSCCSAATTRWADTTSCSGTTAGSSSRPGAGPAGTTEVTVVDVVRGREPRPLRIGGLSSTGVLIEAGGRILATSTERSEYGQLLAADPSPDGDWGGVAGAGADRPSPRCSPASHCRGWTATAGSWCCTRSTGAAGWRCTTRPPARGCSTSSCPGDGTVAAINATDEPATLALSYADWVRPMSVWHLDLRSGRRHAHRGRADGGAPTCRWSARPTAPATAPRSR